MTAMERGICAFGVYLPRPRLSRATIAEANLWANPALKALATGERTFCNFDEDAVTMAVAAARDCLVGVNRSELRAVHFASTTPTFADRSHAGLIADALALDENLATLDVGASQRCATSGLINLLEHPGGRGADLLAASDQRLARPGSPQEMLYGHGGAAVLVGDHAPLARVLSRHSIARDLVDHYRAADERFDYTLEERWVRDEGYLKIVPDAVGVALRQAGVEIGAVDHVLLPGSRKIATALATELGVAPERLRDNFHSSCGDTGAAHPLLMLAEALEHAAPREKILLASFGQGADALLLQTTPQLAKQTGNSSVSDQVAAGKLEEHYTRYLSFNGLLSMDWGLRAERDNRTAQTTFYRKRQAISGFVGGRCADCGTAQFPRTKVCVYCGALDSQTDHAFADSIGYVKSFTEDWLAHTPSPPLLYGNVEFEGGANVMMEFTDCGPGEIQVGAPVRMVFRIKDIDERRDFRRYFWKAAPAGTSGGGV